MFRLILQTCIFCFALYACYWLYDNLDFISVFTKTTDSFKYELSSENLKYAFDHIKETSNMNK